jgi:hypothetical protein
LPGKEKMKCLTQELYTKLLENGSPKNRDNDHLPVVKLFTPDANATWLLTEIDPDEPTHAFGLCDLGHGCPELGYVSLAELSVLRGSFGLAVERDLYFEPVYPISVYAEAARNAERIVTDDKALFDIAQRRQVPQHPRRASPQPL